AMHRKNTVTAQRVPLRLAFCAGRLLPPSPSKKLSPFHLLSTQQISVPCPATDTDRLSALNGGGRQSKSYGLGAGRLSPVRACRCRSGGFPFSAPPQRCPSAGPDCH